MTKGKLIYQPDGKAREYSPWACNLYNGCSNRCEYCYNRTGVSYKLLGKDNPTLKSGFNNDDDKALSLFEKELKKFKDSILADGKGLFFNFVSDPFLEETWSLNYRCAKLAVEQGVPVVFLSKKVPPKIVQDFAGKHNDMVKVGFTLTGRDDLEPEADPNRVRIEAMRKLWQKGVKTWASIEPVIDIANSMIMIKQAHDYGQCYEFKIGLTSRKKTYTPEEILKWKTFIDEEYTDCNILWKESVLKYIEKAKAE